MILAVNTGISHSVWMSDPAAMSTAVRYLNDQHQKAKHGRN